MRNRAPICTKPAYLLGASWDGKSPSTTHILKSADDVRNADDYELGIVLLSLISYLGHKNPLISGVAFNEVSS
jgi:hypothetical protein